MIEEDYSFQCPYCWAEIFIRLDPTAGKRQNFTYDCELCCNPIQVRVQFDEEGDVSDFSADRES